MSYDANGQKLARESTELTVTKFAIPKIEYVFGSSGGMFEISSQQGVEKFLITLSANGQTQELVLDNDANNLTTSFEGLESGIYQAQIIAKSENGNYYQSDAENFDKEIYKMPILQILGKGGVENSNQLKLNVLTSESLIASKFNVAGLNQTINGFTANQTETSELFMHYVFTYIRQSIQNSISGSIQDNINIEYLKSLDFKIPEKSYQDKIVAVLSGIDEKIELNLKICSELEDMAKTIYDYWFVQFDFPDENGKPYRSSGGEMVWNEQFKRKIPKGWDIKRISDICEIISGYPFQSSTYSKTGKYKLITIKNVQDSGIDLNIDNYIKDLPANLPNYCILSPGDILMSLTGNVGRVGLMYVDDCLLNQRVALIKPKHSCLNVFLYFLFKNDRLKIMMKNISTGTSQKNLSPIDVGNLVIPFNVEIVKLFCDKLASIITKIVITEKEKVELIKLRDWLLPMLMNGQARVE